MSLSRYIKWALVASSANPRRDSTSSQFVVVAGILVTTAIIRVPVAGGVTKMQGLRSHSMRHSGKLGRQEHPFIVFKSI